MFIVPVRSFRYLLTLFFFLQAFIELHAFKAHVAQEWFKCWRKDDPVLKKLTT